MKEWKGIRFVRWQAAHVVSQLDFGYLRNTIFRVSALEAVINL